MKKIKLIDIHLENFKGIKELTINFLNHETNIFGANATGKTTILDAFTWLLFDKDSNNKKDFAIKTRDQNGKEIDKLNHIVTATLLIDDEKVELSKKYSEKWVKKRGEQDQMFSGNVTDYHIDGIPKKANEYKKFVSDLLDEEIFKLITNPLYFNEQYDWKKRRSMLIKISGNVSDKDVIDSSAELKDLEVILGKHSVDDKLKQIAEQKKEYKRQIQLIPELINEAEKAKEDVTGLNPSDIEGEIILLKQQIEEKQEELQAIKSGSARAILLKRKAELQADLAVVKQELQQDIMKKIEYVDTDIRETEFLMTEDKRVINQLLDEIADLVDSIDRIDEKVQSKRIEWNRVRKMSFDEHKKTCPTCGQELPESEIETLIVNFNNERAKRLREIEAEGEKLASQIKESKELITSKDEHLESMKEKYGALAIEIPKKVEELANLKEDLKKCESDPKYVEAKAEIEKIESQIMDSNGSTASQQAEVQIHIDKFNAEISELQVDLNKFKTNERQEKRIAELNNQFADVNDRFAELEKAVYLIDKFNQTKSNLLESKINSKFEYVTFQLFKTQINGGIEECCETLFNGVPYNSGLNNAARINGGLDIINALTNHLQTIAPVFIDNRESVTNLIDTDAQIINLIVSGKDKKLRVEE